MALAVAVADTPGVDRLDERLTISTPTAELPATELADHHGGRLHVVDVPEDFPDNGQARIEYTCTFGGSEDAPVGEPADLIRYVRPSRYAESDKLFPTANALFGAYEGMALLDAVADWVHENTSYVPGSSRPTDGAADTFLARQGICRDFAHVVVAMLRARNVPARVVANYAPGLVPMDFHAVAEAWLDGSWHLVDASRMSDTGTIARISTGADSSDTAFLTTVRGGLYLDSISVDARLEEN